MATTKETRKLFLPGSVGNLTIKNRIAMAPMGNRPDVDGGYETSTPYLVARAKGGVGMIITGCTTVSDEFEPHPTNAHYSYTQNWRVAAMADQIHAYGSTLCVQLSPGIGRMNFIDPFTPPYSASAVPSYAFPDLICKEMPADGLKRLAKAMGFSASLLKRAGADLVEVHAYGGYLIDQFNSALWNKRNDEYGGSFTNRTRFLREIIEQIRLQCGKDFPIAVKLTLESVFPDEERPRAEGIELAKMLNDLGVDLLHIGRGSYFCRWRMVSSVYQPYGFDMDAVKFVKDMFPDMPIMGHGKLNHVEVAEKAVAEGYMDYVAIGHGLLADPDWVNKAKENRCDDIIPCIGCGECHHQTMTRGQKLGCAVNPMTSHEHEYEMTPTTSGKKVLVIGGGPAGLKAAALAGERGFETTLWEKNGYLGGELKAAGAPYNKKDVADQVDYLIRQVQKQPVTVKTNFEATIDDVKKLDPDYVIVATGATPIVVPVPGHDKDNVMLAEEVLLRQKETGDNVVVIGGGLVGCETALELEHRKCKVTIVEMLDKLLKTADHFVANDQNLKYLMDNSNIDVQCNTKLTEIKDDCVVVEQDGQLKEIPCDSVVFAVGFRSNHDLYKQILEAGYECRQVGDNIKPGKVVYAINQAFHAIRVLE